MNWILARRRSPAPSNSSAELQRSVEGLHRASNKIATSDGTRFDLDFAKWYAALAAPNSRVPSENTKSSEVAVDQPPEVVESLTAEPRAA
jgi:hypothetical protein